MSSAKRKTLEVEADDGRSQILKTIVGQEYCLEALQKIIGNWAEIEEPLVTHCILEVR